MILTITCVQPGPDPIGIVAISHGCTGVAARACGLVGLEPARVSSFSVTSIALVIFVSPQSLNAHRGTPTGCRNPQGSALMVPRLPSCGCPERAVHWKWWNHRVALYAGIPSVGLPLV